jgi:formylglycine-generating enzyme required for sulfatase activity
VGTGLTGGGGGGEPLEFCDQTSGTAELIGVTTPNGGRMCIDATEVTKGQYETWLNGSPAPAGMPTECAWNTDYTPQDASWPPGGVGLNEPVVGVDWCDALGYCRDHGKRLCGGVGGGSIPLLFYADADNNEWFNACSERNTQAYPYGPAYNPNHCNGDSTVGAVVDVGSAIGCRGTEPLFDLSGNVWEWEHSCDGTAGGTDLCRLRGGAFDSPELDLACAADLTRPRDTQRSDVGFRCCAAPIL